LSSPKLCIFREKQAANKEHIVSKWILNDFVSPVSVTDDPSKVALSESVSNLCASCHRGLQITADSGNIGRMSTLMDIEQAAVKLPAREQQQLLRFLLRVFPVADAELPEPRQFSEKEIQGWLAEDEGSMRRFQSVCSAPSVVPCLWPSC